MVRPFSPVWHPLVCESWLCPECVYSSVECTFWKYSIVVLLYSTKLSEFGRCSEVSWPFPDLLWSVWFATDNSEGVDLLENTLKMKCQSTQSSPLNFLTLTQLQLTWMWVSLHAYVYREERETLITKISIYPSPSWCQSTLEVWMCSPREEEETSLPSAAPHGLPLLSYLARTTITARDCCWYMQGTLQRNTIPEELYGTASIHDWTHLVCHQYISDDGSVTEIRTNHKCIAFTIFLCTDWRSLQIVHLSQNSPFLSLKLNLGWNP